MMDKQDKNLKDIPDSRTIVTYWNLQNVPNDAPDLRKYGFAPGGYLFRCGACKEQQAAAKRSINCYECALKMYNKDNVRKQFVEQWAEKINLDNGVFLTHIKTSIDILDNDIHNLIDTQQTTKAIQAIISMKSLQKMVDLAEKYMNIQRLCKEDEVSKC